MIRDEHVIPDPPRTQSSSQNRNIADQASTGSHRSGHGFWYCLLLPLSLIYTLVARDIAGPGYTTAPNQGAMVVFGFAAVAWPVLAMVIAGAIRFAFRVRGAKAAIIGIVCWALSCFVPFAVGMK